MKSIFILGVQHLSNEATSGPNIPGLTQGPGNHFERFQGRSMTMMFSQEFLNFNWRVYVLRIVFKRIFVFQFGAVFLAICCILERKSPICMLLVAFWS